MLEWQKDRGGPPPALSPDDPPAPARDPLYADVPEEDLPLTESLDDTMERLLPYSYGVIAPELRKGRIRSSSSPTATPCARWWST